MIAGLQFEGRPRRSLTRGPVAQLQRGKKAPAGCLRLRMIFPEGIPVTELVPVPATLEGLGQQECYFLDVPRVTDAQLELVGAYVISLCGGGRPGEVIASLLQGVPMPVRASLIAATSVPLALLL